VKSGGCTDSQPIASRRFPCGGIRKVLTKWRLRSKDNVGVTKLAAPIAPDAPLAANHRADLMRRRRYHRGLELWSPTAQERPALAANSLGGAVQEQLGRTVT